MLGTLGLYNDKRQTWEGDVRNPRWAKAFLKMAGLFWLPYHKKIPCKLKQRNSWTEEKQFHQPLSGNCQQQHPRRRLIFSCSKRLIVCRFVIADLIYFWFTIRFPCLKSAYTYASLTIKLPLLWKAKQGKTRGL